MLTLFALALIAVSACEAGTTSSVESDISQSTPASSPTATSVPEPTSLAPRSTPEPTTAPDDAPDEPASTTAATPAPEPTATPTSAPTQVPEPASTALPTSTPQATPSSDDKLTVDADTDVAQDAESDALAELAALIDGQVDDETAEALKDLATGQLAETGEVPTLDELTVLLGEQMAEQASADSEVPAGSDLMSLFAAMMGGGGTNDEPTSTSSESTGLDYAITFEGSRHDRFTSSFFRTAWKQSLDAALVTSECPAVEPAEYPDGYYTGPLIDTHLHMPPLSDELGSDTVQRDNVGGVDAGLYNAIAQNDRPVLGVTVTLDEIACTLEQEGSTTAYTFFPTYQNAPAALVDLAYNAVERHGPLFIPFIQSTNSQTSGVEGEVLQQMLELRPNLYKGLGEIGDSPTEPINLPPDDPFYTGAFEVAQAHGLPVYFHPGWENHENLDRALKAFPETNFLVHADNIRPYIGDLMADNPNVYYTYNDIFDEITPQFRFGDKQDFIDAMERDWDALLDQAMIHYEDLINTYPDRFMWGTDRADIVWNYHADIGQLLVKFGRDFIGRLDPEIQKKIGHLNAEEFMQ